MGLRTFLTLAALPENENDPAFSPRQGGRFCCCPHELELPACLLGPLPYAHGPLSWPFVLPRAPGGSGSRGTPWTTPLGQPVIAPNVEKTNKQKMCCFTLAVSGISTSTISQWGVHLTVHKLCTRSRYGPPNNSLGFVTIKKRRHRCL